MLQSILGIFLKSQPAKEAAVLTLFLQDPGDRKFSLAIRPPPKIHFVVHRDRGDMRRESNVGYLVNFLLAGGEAAIQDIVVDGVVEEHHVLGDLPHDAPQTLHIHLQSRTAISKRLAPVLNQAI